MSAQPKRRYTLEEYLELDKNSDERLEYWDGEIFSMAGVNDEHDRIESNIHFLLRSRLDEAKCRTFLANMRIKVPTLPPYRYGDLSALCGKPVFEKIGGVDVLTNPTLIIEVLSSSTSNYDRVVKFTHYKSIPSFREYLLVAQDRPHITQFIKRHNGMWIHREFNDLNDPLGLAAMECEFSLSEVYQNVNFKPRFILSYE
ncbi:MAG TPA: Uma2 family endonuclease [Blastocatellia bacterium]|nr:Uma2 family endonuclease [Blastocatellia bacterium]